MPELGRFLIVLGLAVALAGTAVWLAPSVPWLGRLPGDLKIERPGGTIYVPVTTCILVSVVLTVLFNLLGRSR